MLVLVAQDVEALSAWQREHPAWNDDASAEKPDGGRSDRAGDDDVHTVHDGRPRRGILRGARVADDAPGAPRGGETPEDDRCRRDVPQRVDRVVPRLDACPDGGVDHAEPGATRRRRRTG